MQPWKKREREGEKEWAISNENKHQAIFHFSSLVLGCVYLPVLLRLDILLSRFYHTYEDMKKGGRPRPRKKILYPLRLWMTKQGCGEEIREQGGKVSRTMHKAKQHLNRCLVALCV